MKRNTPLHVISQMLFEDGFYQGRLLEKKEYKTL